MQLNYPEHVCFVCLKCGLCCGDTPKKTRHILLPYSDARKISAVTNQPIGSFAKPIAGKDPYVFEMNKSTQGKCVFLKNDKCTIYGTRPLICRFYPFELQGSDNKAYVFNATDECPGISFTRGEKAKKIDRGFFEALLQLANSHLKGYSTPSFLSEAGERRPKYSATAIKTALASQPSPKCSRNNGT